MKTERVSLLRAQHHHRSYRELKHSFEDRRKTRAKFKTLIQFFPSKRVGSLFFQVPFALEEMILRVVNINSFSEFYFLRKRRKTIFLLTKSCYFLLKKIHSFDTDDDIIM